MNDVLQDHTRVCETKKSKLLGTTGEWSKKGYATAFYVDLISEVLPFGQLWYGEPNAISNAIGYAKFRSRSHDAVIRVYYEAGNVIETHEHKGEFKGW